MSRNSNARYRHRTFVFVSCLILVAAPLVAGESPWYVQLKLGSASVDTNLGSRALRHFEGDESAGAVEVGYTVNRYFAIQAGYHDLGELEGQGSPCPDGAEVCVAIVPGCIEGTNPICEGPVSLEPLTADLKGLSLSLVPRWPIHERFSIFGKVGVVDWDAEVFRSFGLGRIDSLSDRDLLTGVGVQYTFPKGLGLVLEYQKLDLDLEQTSLGASWRF